MCSDSICDNSCVDMPLIGLPKVPSKSTMLQKPSSFADESDAVSLAGATSDLKPGDPDVDMPLISLPKVPSKSTKLQKPSSFADESDADSLAGATSDLKPGDPDVDMPLIGLLKVLPTVLHAKVNVLLVAINFLKSL